MKEQLHQQLQSAPNPAQLRKQLRELEEAHPQLTLPRQLEEIQEMALRIVVEDEAAGPLKKALKKLPAQPEPLSGALARLLSLLGRLDSEKELCLNAAGQVQAPPASALGPLLVDCLEQISAAARSTWPDAPSPGEAISWFWPVKPEPPGGPDLEPLRQHLDRLSRLDQAIESTNRAIKLIDRINIFTDSPEEARLKQHKAERKAAENQWKELRRDYRQAASVWRYEQEGPFLSDRLVGMLTALAQVSTRRGRSRSPLSCPLNHAESIIPDCNWLLERQAERYGFSGDYASLVPEVCAAKPGEANLPERLKAHLGNALNAAVKAAQLAESELKEASHFTANAEKKITLMDRINIFSDSPRETAAKEARKVQQELSGAAQRAQEEIRKVLLDGLQSFPEANLYYMCVELRALCESLRAVCRSESVTRGSGDSESTTTEYWCEIIGLDSARRQAVLCACTFHQYHGQIHGLYRHLTRLRMAQVQEPSLAETIRRLYS